MKTRTISVKGSEITVSRKEQEDERQRATEYHHPHHPLVIIMVVHTLSYVIHDFS